MKLNQFAEVLAIAEQGSIRAAARHLGMGQPALTRSLAELERELGAPLFERRARGVAATAVGEAFVRRAASIVQQVRRTREEALQLCGAGSGSVTVGLSIAAHIALLPSSLAPFRARFPAIQLHLIEGFLPTLQGALRAGSVDFYIGPDAGPQASPQLSREMLFRNRRTVLCRLGHPLARARSLAALEGAGWVTTSITADAQDEIGALFQERGLQAPRLAVRCQSALSLLTCLAHSDLLAMVPVQWSGFAPARNVLTTIPVADELAAPAIVVVRNADMPLTPAAAFLLDLMRRARGRLAVVDPP